jgi:hypothetical protein
MCAEAVRIKHKAVRIKYIHTAQKTKQKKGVDVHAKAWLPTVWGVVVCALGSLLGERAADIIVVEMVWVTTSVHRGIGHVNEVVRLLETPVPQLIRVSGQCACAVCGVCVCGGGGGDRAILYALATHSERARELEKRESQGQ